MEAFLWLMIIAAAGSFVWLFYKLSNIKQDTFSEAEMKQIQKTREELQQKKDSGQLPKAPSPKPSSPSESSQIKPKTQPEIKNDPDSGISYE